MELAYAMQAEASVPVSKKTARFQNER